MVVQGRELSPRDIQEIVTLIAARPRGTRWTLSRELCETVGMANPDGPAQGHVLPAHVEQAG